jgi:type VI secretion system protein ImpL
VEPAELVDFLLRFQQTEATLRAGLGKGAQVDPAARAALGFVEQIAAVRDFMAPLMEGSMEEAGPAYDIDVEFRVNRPREVGGNQIIDWAVELGGQRLVRGREPRAARWRPGDPVAISLRWAKDAPMVPLPSGGIDAPTIEDRTVTFFYGNRWSLVRALDAHRSMPADFERLTDPQPHTLRFVVPTGAAPDGGGSTAGATAAQPETGVTARVFVRLSASSPGEGGKERRRHVLPQFPHRAPAADLASTF